MAEARIDPIEQIPDADLLEQQAQLDPTLIDDEGLVYRAGYAASAEPLDPTNSWEQQRPMPSDEEYPRDDPDDGFKAG